MSPIMASIGALWLGGAVVLASLVFSNPSPYGVTDIQIALVVSAFGIGLLMLFVASVASRVNALLSKLGDLEHRLQVIREQLADQARGRE